jgi:excisionase family DNA binding protein
MFSSPESANERREGTNPTAYDHAEPTPQEPQPCPLAVSGTCGMRPVTANGTPRTCDTRGARVGGTRDVTGPLPAHAEPPYSAHSGAAQATGVPAYVPVPTEDRLWGPAEAAMFLGMSESWVYTAARSGVLPAIRLGRAVRFDPRTLRAWVRGEPTGYPVRLPRCR